MNVDDLIEAVRTAGYVDFSQIAYAIFETNGQLCVVEKEQQQQGQQQDQSENGEQPQTLLPLELVIDGKYIEQNLSLSGTENRRSSACSAKTDCGCATCCMPTCVRTAIRIYRPSVSPRFAAVWLSKGGITGEKGSRYSRRVFLSWSAL